MRHWRNIWAIWIFVIRDTWEIDNLKNIRVLKEEGNLFLYSGRYKDAIKIYNEIYADVGNRQLKNKLFIDLMHNVNYSYEEAKTKYEEKLYSLAHTKYIETQKLIEALKYDKGIERYNDIIKIISGSITESNRLTTLKEKVKGDIKSAKTLLQERIAKEKARKAEEKRLLLAEQERIVVEYGQRREAKAAEKRRLAKQHRLEEAAANEELKRMADIAARTTLLACDRCFGVGYPQEDVAMCKGYLEARQAANTGFTKIPMPIPTCSRCNGSGIIEIVLPK